MTLKSFVTEATGCERVFFLHTMHLPTRYALLSSLLQNVEHPSGSSRKTEEVYRIHRSYFEHSVRKTARGLEKDLQNNTKTEKSRDVDHGVGRSLPLKICRRGQSVS